MLRTVAIALPSCLIALAFAEASEEEPPRMLEVLEAAGLQDRLEEQLAFSQHETRVQLDQVFLQTQQAAPELSPEIRERLRAISDEMVESVLSSISAKEVLTVYARAIEQAYTPEEMDELIATLSTPSGQHLLFAVNSAASASYEYQASQLHEALARATQTYFEKYQLILEDIRRGK